MFVCMCVDFILALVTEHITDMSAVISTEYSFHCWENRSNTDLSRVTVLTIDVCVCIGL